MYDYKLLVLEDDDMVDGHLRGGDRPIWEAHCVVLIKENGHHEILKDRWEGPSSRKIEIHLP